tara:strand:- start:276 stop:872 length:597 start_codon:yes stop_codon:yes gene_type:complete
MSAFSYGRFMPSSKAQAPQLAAATQAQGNLDTAAQARVDALRGQNMNAVGNLANKGYDAYQEGMFDGLFQTQPATDLGIEAGANTITADLGMEAGANSLIGTGTGGGIGAAPVGGAVNPMAASIASEAAAATTAAEAAAAVEAATALTPLAATAAPAVTGGLAAAAPAATAGLGAAAGAASAAFPPLAIALLASQLFG